MASEGEQEEKPSINQEAAVKPTVSLDYVYVSDIELSCRTSSKSLLALVKYTPTVEINIGMLILESFESLSEHGLWEKVQNHYLAELNLKQLLRANLKNVAVVAQLLKVSHALVSIYQYVKYRDREVGPYLDILKDFILWNLFKAGELGASVVGDLIGALGNFESDPRLRQHETQQVFRQSREETFPPGERQYGLLEVITEHTSESVCSLTAKHCSPSAAADTTFPIFSTKFRYFNITFLNYCTASRRRDLSQLVLVVLVDLGDDLL